MNWFARNLKFFAIKSAEKLNMLGWKYSRFLIIFVVVGVFVDRYVNVLREDEAVLLSDWLSENKYDKWKSLILEGGISSKTQLASLTKLDVCQMFPADARNTVENIVVKLINEHQFETWLKNNNILANKMFFREVGISSLQDVLQNFHKLEDLNELPPSVLTAAESLKKEVDFESYPTNADSMFCVNVWQYIYIFVKVAIAFLIILALCGLVSIYMLACSLRTLFRPLDRLTRRSCLPAVNPFISALKATACFLSWFSHPPRHSSRATTGSQGVLAYVFGGFFDKKQTSAVWNFDAGGIVGEEVTLIIYFYHWNRQPFNPSKLSTLCCEVLLDATMIPMNIVYCDSKDSIAVQFTPIRAGLYTVKILANGESIRLLELNKLFKPGKIDAEKSSLVVPSSLLVLEKGRRETICFDERDKFGNSCVSELEDLCNYEFEVFQLGDGNVKITPEVLFHAGESAEQHKAWLTLSTAGIFTTTVYYNGDVISDNVTLMVLTESEMKQVNKNISNMSWYLYFEAYLYAPLVKTTRLSTLDSQNGKRKKVFCYFTPKMFTVKEYHLKIFPKTLSSFRIRPSSKIVLSSLREACSGHPAFQVTSAKGSLTLYAPQRNVVVAMFEKLMLNNIGGSQSFEEKRKYLYSRLDKAQKWSSAIGVTLKVNRESILSDAYQSMKNWSVAGWWKEINVKFAGEQGMDYGGLSREFMQLLCNELFNKSGALFRKFNEDDTQALIHPNPFRAATYQKVKLFEFAGLLVGKCIIDSAIRPKRQQFLKARFTRSFLSTVLGMGVDHQHFATDDKSYYSGKIKYILENDPADLEIYFTEDVYDLDNVLVKTVDLVPNGSQIKVTESNKISYLQRLAEYRLLESVSDEIEAFLKGLHTLIPEGLLSNFDVNELELLVCGMEEISVVDWKENTQNSFFKRNLFWSVISGFNQEQLSKLLQFTTGCSQLPPEGFKGLDPKFNITSVGDPKALPTAHTCFNNLCLPNYLTREAMREKLLIAINEGSEGFGLT